MLKSTEVGSVCYERQALLSKCKMNLSTNQKQTHSHRKQTYSYQRARGEVIN